jgi:hypothetical protein
MSATEQSAKANPRWPRAEWPVREGGPGNPYAHQVAALRLRARDGVSGDDVE